MAVTKIIPIRATIGKSIAYICNPNKTENCAFVSSENCFAQTASVEFDFYLRKARAGGNTLGRHLIQSFSPDETTPEQAHEIGKQLMAEHLKGEYAYVMTTHVDRAHIHNHFVWCAVNLKTHHRYHSNKRSYHEIQEASDRICLEKGLSVIKSKSENRGTGHYEHQMKMQGTSYRETLKRTIDQVVASARSYNDFLHQMQAQGYEVKQGTFLSFKHRDATRFTRAKTIGIDYTEERIQARIQQPPTTKQAKEIRQLHDLTASKFQQSVGLARWGKVQNVKIMAKTFALLQEKGLTDLSQFDHQYANAVAVFDQVTSKLKATEARIKTLTEVQKQLRIYGRTKDLYGQFRKVRNKDKFIRETEGAERDIMLHETAKRFLFAYQKEHGQSLSMKNIKAELATCQKEKTDLYEQYTVAKAEKTELTHMHVNLQQMLRTDNKAHQMEVQKE